MATPEAQMSPKEQKAYNEALRKMEACLKKGQRGTTLDLGELGLTRLPSAIGQLQALTELDLSGNQLTSLPPEIGQLQALTELALFGNQLTSLPPEIGQLQALTRLSLSSNQLRSLPPEIGKLQALTGLYLNNNKLTSLLPEIGQLQALTGLYLMSNQLTSLPPEIGQLQALTQLSLSSNQLTSLPPEIGQLQALRLFYLANNRLPSVPSEIGQLKNLRQLSFAGNRLTTLPPEIGQLHALMLLLLEDNQLTSLPSTISKLSALTELYLHNNPGLGIPESVLGPSVSEVYPSDVNVRTRPARPADILNFYFARQADPTALSEVGELKMMLVGRGGAGKTSLRRFFLHQPHDPEEKETPGIALDKATLRCRDQDIVVRLWDFAGQEITHALHQFFLTEGCVYVLVLDPRSNTEMQDAEYWLKLLRRYAGGAPVVVAMNRQDARKGGYDVDRRGLEERFPFVKHFIPTNCETRDGCEELSEAVCAVINNLKETEPPRLKVPPTWLAVMQECRAKKEQKHLTLAEFGQICAQHGERDQAKQESLARLLHQLGVVLHFVDEPRLRDTSVLDPHWVTNGVYCLLRFKDHPHSDGTLTLAEAREALPEESEEGVLFLLRLMERFEMCFPMDEEGVTVTTRWLIPGALDPFQPASIGPEWQEPGSVRMRYVYDPLPEGVIPRFIVQTHLLSEGQARWRNGVVLVEGHARALIRRGEKPNHVEITAFGPVADRLRLLQIIQGSFERINADVPGPSPVAELELEGLPGIYRSIADLEAAELIEEPVVVAVPPDKAKVEPTPQLNRTSDKADRDPEKVPLKAFLSYSHDDKRAKVILENNLTVLMKKRFITTWHDGLIEPGMRWREEIEQNLEKMDVFIGLLTTAFLASDFIEQVEIKAARERLKKQDRDFVFVLILVDDISLQGLDLAEYQVLKPGGKAISQHASRKAGFDTAQKELEKLLAKRQAENKKTNRNSPTHEFTRTHTEVVSEGVTLIVKGDYIHGNKSMNTTNSGINYGNMGEGNTQTITGSFNQTITDLHGPELAALFEKLTDHLKPLEDEMKGKDYRVLESHLETIKAEAQKPEPDKGLLSVSGKGLIEAAQTVGAIAGPVITTAGLILKFFGIELP